MQVVFWRPQKYADWDMTMSPPTSRGTFTSPALGPCLYQQSLVCVCAGSYDMTLIPNAKTRIIPS